MRIKYSCVIDNKERYQKQGWLWLNSLIYFGKINPSDIFVHCVNPTDKNYTAKLEKIGVNVESIEPYGDKTYCNKIMQMSNPKLKDSDAIILMDTDMIMLENFENTIDYNHISSKIVYYPNPETPVIDKLFELAGLKKTLPDKSIELKNYLTYGANFNGGLYIIPQKYYETIKEGWEKWALWMLIKENGKPLYDAKKEAHIDQLSFCMAIHENNIPVKYLDRLYNCHVLLDYGELEKIPYILHYHTSADKSADNLIELDYKPVGSVKKAVETANEFIKKYINML